MSLDPLLPLPLLLALLGLAFTATGLLFARQRHLLRPCLRWRFLGLRLLVLTLLGLLLLNPFLTRTQPEAGAYEVAILADTSASMLTRDTTDARPRLEHLRDILASDAPLRSRLDEQHPVRLYQFAEDLLPLGRQLPSLAPGETALGNALLNATEASPTRLGAIVLLSDGISLAGTPPLTAARRLRDSGIPVSVIGIGETTSPGNLSVTFPNPDLTATRDEPLDLAVSLENTFPEDRTVRLSLFAGDQPLAQTRALTLPAGESLTETFTHIPAEHGRRSLRAVIEGSRPDALPADDVAYASLEVLGPQRLRVLHLAGPPDWDSRQLRLAFRNHNELRIDTLVRLSADRFRLSSSDPEVPLDDREELLPPEDELFTYDALIVNGRALADIDDDALAQLQAFVSRKGGGLLVTAPLAQPEALRRLGSILPVKALDPLPPSRADRPLELIPEPIFTDPSTGPLLKPGDLFAPEQLPLQAGLEPRPGARTAATLDDGGIPLLLAQPYGAGRTAFFGLQASWQWPMRREAGAEHHRRFWHGLLRWLALGGKNRLDPPLEGERLPLGQPARLDVRLLAKDFRGAAGARVNVNVTAPNGSRTQLPLTPSLRQPGQYEGLLPLEATGEYRLDTTATFPDGEELNRTSFFTATATGPESRDTDFREALLRDLARLTGGTYATYRDPSRILPLALANEIPGTSRRYHWARHWSLLALLFLAAALEWTLRRRHGLV